MNKKILLSLGVGALLSAGAITSCGGVSGPEQSDTVFDNARFYYDTSLEEEYDISVRINSTLPVTGITQGRNTAEAGQYINRDGVLTIAGEFLGTLNAGERTLRVSLEDGSSLEVEAFLVNKVITTAQEFQDINNQLDGYYILGNDIDLSSIDNFEPLGYYYTETSPLNQYFHGILDGNGYTVKNAKVYYSDTVGTNYNVYNNTGTRFSSDAHSSGDNVGLFQIIGSSGVVRHVNFSNIDVRGRTIVGAIAGNVAGTVHDVYIDSQCDVEMSTHFYDDDCNMGGAFGIVGGSGVVYNCISEIDHLTLGATSTFNVNYNGESLEVVNGVYLDFGPDYVGETGNGWDHPASGEGVNAPWWRFAGVDKDDITDSNQSPSNGQYAFVGKCWGSVSNCVARSFNITPMSGTSRAVNFGQTHLAANKPTSGDTDLGSITSCQMLSGSEMTSASNYTAFDNEVWNIADGSVPTLRRSFTYTVAESAE